MDRAQLVFGVWPDESEPHGVGYRIVKGHELLQHSVATNRNLTTMVSGIVCECEEHAMALESVYAERTLIKQ